MTSFVCQQDSVNKITRLITARQTKFGSILAFFLHFCEAIEQKHKIINTHLLKKSVLSAGNWIEQNN